MLEIQRTASEKTRAVCTEIRMPDEGLTLITTLLETVLMERTYYSIAVTLIGEAPYSAEARLIKDITGDADTAECLFRKIADGTVTPCTLTDVLEDAL